MKTNVQQIFYHLVILYFFITSFWSLRVVCQNDYIGTYGETQKFNFSSNNYVIVADKSNSIKYPIYYSSETGKSMCVVCSIAYIVCIF